MNELVIPLRSLSEIQIQLGCVTVNPVIGDAEEYRGEYDVLPSPEQQVLPTALKFCADDITVRAIPYYAVSNNAGGTTIVIDRLEP